MDESALNAATQAIEAAAAVRAELRRRKPPDRDRRLSDQLFALAEAREPLRRHLLRAPKATARYYAPEVRAVSEQITAERRRLQRMLYGKPGRAGELRGPLKPVRATDGGKDWYVNPRKKPIPASHLRGTVDQAEGALVGIE